MSNAFTSTTTPAPEPSMNMKAGGNYRWVVCALLFFAVTINSLDKFVISYLKPFFCSQNEFADVGFHWSNADFSYVTTSFTIVWSIATIFAGVFIDKVGSRRGLGIAVTIWSVFEMLNALAGPRVIWHCITRSLLGVGEAGCFPGALKTAADWFPKKERAFATGIFNAGASIGAMTAALFVPWCLAFYGGPLGWKMALIYTGAFGFVWLFFWWRLGGMPALMRGKKLSEAEYAYIHQDGDVGAAANVAAEKPRGDLLERFIAGARDWGKLLTYRQTWAYSLGKFMTDGIWWFYLFWLPDYLTKQFNMTVEQVRWPTFIAWGAAIIGSVFGGRVSLFLMNRGWSVYKARLGSVLMFASLPLSVLSVQYFSNIARFGDNALIYTMALICFALAAHQMWSANLYTTPSDWFPKKAVASVSAIGIAAGGLGGALIQIFVGQLTDHFEKLGDKQMAYSIMFVVAASVYLIAWAMIKFLVPRFKQVTDI